MPLLPSVLLVLYSLEQLLTNHSLGNYRAANLWTVSFPFRRMCVCASARRCSAKFYTCYYRIKIINLVDFEIDMN